MRNGKQHCRLCGERLGSDWAARGIATKDAPRWKPGQHVVMDWNPPYRRATALHSYSGDVSQIEACV